jgi:hypothetical protein
MESKIIHKKRIINKNFSDVHNDGVLLLYSFDLEINTNYEDSNFNGINSVRTFYLQVTTRNKISLDFIDSDKITDDIIFEWISDEIKDFEKENILLFHQ